MSVFTLCCPVRAIHLFPYGMKINLNTALYVTHNKDNHIVLFLLWPVIAA